MTDTRNALIILGLGCVSVGFSLLGEPLQGAQYFRVIGALVAGMIFGTLIGRRLMDP